MNTEETVSTLNKMKDVLMERGWTKAALESDSGKVCLVGARNIAMGRSNDTHLELTPYMQDEISDVLTEAIGTDVDLYTLYSTSSNPVAKVYAWNDQRATGINDVLDMIDRAIIMEKEKA